MRPLQNAPVAQLDRAFGYEPKGRTFESCRAHQQKQQLTVIFGWPFRFNGHIHGHIRFQKHQELFRLILSKIARPFSPPSKTIFRPSVRTSGGRSLTLLGVRLLFVPIKQRGKPVTEREHSRANGIILVFVGDVSSY